MGSGVELKNEVAEGHCAACASREADSQLTKDTPDNGHHVCHFSARIQPHPYFTSYIHIHVTKQLKLQVAATDADDDDDDYGNGNEQATA